MKFTFESLVIFQAFKKKKEIYFHSRIEYFIDI